MKMIAILIFCGTATANAAVYKWTDGSGGTSYSDTPPPGGSVKVMNLPEVSHFKSPALPQSTTTNRPKVADDTGVAAYQRFVITKPANAATVRSAEGLVPVELAIDPPLDDNHFVSFLLDGVSIGGRMQTNAFSMRGVERGTHSLQALLVDAAGNQLATSPVTEFTLRHDTLFMRPDDFPIKPGIPGVPRASTAPKVPSAP